MNRLTRKSGNPFQEMKPTSVFKSAFDASAPNQSGDMCSLDKTYISSRLQSLYADIIEQPMPENLEHLASCLRKGNNRA